MKRQRLWLVPVLVVRETTAAVWSASAEDAALLVERGEYMSIDTGGEVVAVDVIGTAVPEEE